MRVAKRLRERLEAHSFSRRRERAVSLAVFSRGVLLVRADFGGGVVFILKRGGDGGAIPRGVGNRGGDGEFERARAGDGVPARSSSVPRGVGVRVVLRTRVGALDTFDIFDTFDVGALGPSALAKPSSTPVDEFEVFADAVAGIVHRVRHLRQRATNLRRARLRHLEHGRARQHRHRGTIRRRRYAIIVARVAVALRLVVSPITILSPSRRAKHRPGLVRREPVASPPRGVQPRVLVPPRVRARLETQRSRATPGRARRDVLRLDDGRIHRRMNPRESRCREERFSPDGT